GGLAILGLPIAQYPEIAPPTVTVTTSFPGANAKTVAETVATPIEEQVNGVENMLYMSSQSNNDGSMKLTVTFAVRTNLDIAPLPAGASKFQYTASALRRLVDRKQFEAIVVKTGAIGRVTYLRDVARVELGAADYSSGSAFDRNPSIGLAIFQLPGSNAIATANAVYAKMLELKKNFPEGMDYKIPYDTTLFVRASIWDVVITLFEGVGLVTLVVLIFLQSWRASLIPMLAIPVSLVGTFAVMWLAGFSMNNLSLFGLVLAIGIVVDDAIVVVENVERWIEHGLSPREAAYKAMEEVTPAVIAIAFGRSAVFI